MTMDAIPNLQNDSSIHLPVSSSTPVNHSGGPVDNVWQEAPRCARCGDVVFDRMMIQVQDKILHCACLRCTSCGQEVTDLCFSDGNNVYCQQDFYRLFGAECAGCSGVITPSESVRRTEEKIYHDSCFNCVMCQQPLCTGNKYYIRDDNKLLCDIDFEKLKHEGKEQQEIDDFDNQHSTVFSKRLQSDISPYQLKYLKQVYKNSQRLPRHLRRQISTKIGLDVNVVRAWFQTQRSVDRKKRRTNRRQDSGVGDIVDSSGSLSDGSENEVDGTGRLQNEVEVQQTTYPKPTQDYFQKWLKDLDSLAANAVPPNIDLKVSDFRPDGEICLSSVGSAHVQYPEGPYWFQKMADSSNSNTPWVQSV